MKDLKVGNYNTDSTVEDLDLSGGAVLPEVNEGTEVPDIILGEGEPVVDVPIEDAPVVDVVEPTTEKEVPEVPNSSEPEGENEFVFDEAKTFEYLSESLNRKIESLDDLKVTSENPLDDDPYLSELYEWRKKTGRPVEEFSKFQKNYDEVSDLDVAREYLQIQYPNFTKEEIEAEMQDFISDDMDMDNEINKKSRQLKKYATVGRAELKKLVAELGEPVKPSYSPEIQKDLELAKQIKSDYEANKEATAAYQKQITDVSSSLDTMKLELSDDLSIDFKVSDDSKKSLPEMISTMPHWKNGDGSWNHQAVVNDAIIIKHHKEMIRLAYEQGRNSGEEQIIQQTNNTTLGQPQPRSGSQSGQKGVEIEGLDQFMGKSGMKLRFNK